MVAKRACRLAILYWSPLAIGLLLCCAWDSVFAGAAQYLSLTISAKNVVYSDVGFTRDGRRLYAIGVTPIGSGPQHVHVVTFDATTGGIIHVVDLPGYEPYFPGTPDGTKLIVRALMADTDHQKLSLLDADSGKVEDIPASWYGSGLPDVRLGEGGRLVSAFTLSDDREKPLLVTVYNWATKKPIARQTSASGAGGISGGGVTEDGQIEFDNNRSGSAIVDRKTEHPLARFSGNSVRSPDGRWEIDFPDVYADPPNVPVVEDGRNGALVGRLDFKISADDLMYATLRGVFCGNTGKFVATSLTGTDVWAFRVPSGKLIATFPRESWRDPAQEGVTSVACSSTGTRVAILAGTRLTLHSLK